MLKLNQELLLTSERFLGFRFFSQPTAVTASCVKVEIVADSALN